MLSNKKNEALRSKSLLKKHKLYHNYWHTISLCVPTAANTRDSKNHVTHAYFLSECVDHIFCSNASIPVDLKNH